MLKGAPEKEAEHVVGRIRATIWLGHIGFGFGFKRWRTGFNVTVSKDEVCRSSERYE